MVLIVRADVENSQVRVTNPYYNPNGGDEPMWVDLNKRGYLWRNCDASVMTW